MRLFLLLVIISFLSGCNQKYNHKLSDKEIISDEILKKVSTELYKTKGLIPCGTGGGMMYQVRMLALSFDYRKPLDIDSGRELLVGAVDKLVAAVNADERIRPYLKNYPFESKNVEIRIFLQNLDGSKIPQGELSIISSTEGILKFKADIPYTQQLQILHTETYEEAVKALQQATMNKTETSQNEIVM